MLDIDVFSPNQFTNIEIAQAYVRAQLTAKGKNSRKHQRKRTFRKLSKSLNISREQLQQELRNKFNGCIPTIQGERVCFLTSYVLSSTKKEPLIRVQEYTTPETIYAQLERAASHTGYSYGGSTKPSMRLQTQRCVSEYLSSKLQVLAERTQQFFDIVAENTMNDDVQKIVYYKAPQEIIDFVQRPTKHPRTFHYRPDVILTMDSRLVLTELESVPGGHGMVSTQETALSPSPEFVAEFAKLLKTKKYRVVICDSMLDYIWEQTAFCKLLNETTGIDAQVIIAASQEKLQSHAENWKDEHCLQKIVDPVEHTNLPAFGNRIRFDENLAHSRLDDADVLRFGYIHNFNDQQLRALEASATVVNSMLPYAECKNLLAFAKTETCRKLFEEKNMHIEYKELLDFIVPTELVKPETRMPGATVLKIAGWHADDWGSRSVKISTLMSPTDWEKTYLEYMCLPRPAIIQPLQESARVVVQYITPQKETGTLLRARMRITPFIFNSRNLLTGMTYRTNTKVHGATDSVQGLLFRE